MWCFILERYTLVIQSLLLFGRHDAILFLGACQQFDEQYPGTQTRTRKEPKPFNNPATLFHVFHFTSPTLHHRYPRPHLFGHHPASSIDVFFQKLFVKRIPNCIIDESFLYFGGVARCLVTKHHIVVPTTFDCSRGTTPSATHQRVAQSHLC